MEKPILKMVKSITGSNIWMINQSEWSKICFYLYFGLFPETIFKLYALFTMLAKKTVSVLPLISKNVRRRKKIFDKCKDLKK